MATITASATGGNWSATAAWVGGVVPTATDDVLLTGTSGNITVDGTSGTPSLCRSLVCTGYTNTLAHGTNAGLAVGDPAGGATGALTLVAGMTYTPASAAILRFVSTAAGTNTLTSAGKTLGIAEFNGTGGTFNWADNVSASVFKVFAGTVTSSATKTVTCSDNSYALDISGGTFTLSGALTLTNGAARVSGGTLDMNGCNVTAGTSLQVNGGTLKLSGQFTAGTTISLDSGTILDTGAAGELKTTPSGTYIIFTAGTTATVRKITAQTGIGIDGSLTIPSGGSATWGSGDFAVETTATLTIQGVPTFTSGSLTVAGSSPPVPSSYTFGS